MLCDNERNSVKYGCFLVIPLKYDPASFSRKRLEEIGEYHPLTTMDFNENIKAMLDLSNEAGVGACYTIGCAPLVTSLSGETTNIDTQSFRVSAEGNSYDFDLSTSYLYVFQTQIAFLCLSLSFAHMEALQAICNPGYARSIATLYWIDAAGNEHLFSMEKWLRDFGQSIGLHKFFNGDSSFLVDAYCYTFALVPERFDTLEEMQKITFNLHKMIPLDAPIEDLSEEDIRYVYAVKHQVYNTYRWGCCVSSQTISYVTADETMDFEAQREAQAEDGLPVVLLSLYEKYTCLRFTELITHLDKGQLKQIKSLKTLMLKFQAFGTVTPANLSRWHNVKQIYAYLLEVNDIPTAIQDISSKVNILAEHQQERERARSETVINIITIFGIVSILASVLSIVQILSDGNIWIWLSTILTTLAMILVTMIAIRMKRK